MRAYGVVERFLTDKGYGFITREDAGPSVFVHHSSVKGGSLPLSEGDKVSFEVVYAKRGPQAAAVEKENW